MLPTVLLIALGAAQFHAPQAKAELVASTSAVVPGKSFEVALHMTMAPGWHNYYVNPGESGQATSIDWTLPPGFHAGQIRWPIPERLVVGGVAGYVYENEVWLVTTITTPTDLRRGGIAKLEAFAQWLLCREACVPQKSKLTLSLRVADSATPNPAFAPALKRQATKTTSERFTAKVTKKAAILSVDGKRAMLKGVEFYPADATYFGADPTVTTATPTGIKVEVPLSRYALGRPQRMTGILVIPTGSDKGAHWIDVKVTEH